MLIRVDDARSGEKTKKGDSCRPVRKMRDSNPRYPERGIPDFESSAFGHSANLPLYLWKNNSICGALVFLHAKVRLFCETAKL